MRAGDANLDGRVDRHDIDPFVLGLAAPDAYQARFGIPAVRAGDGDGDGDFDFDDIAAFVRQLSSDSRTQRTQSAGQGRSRGTGPSATIASTERQARPAARHGRVAVPRSTAR
ncbi:MAG: hypothetical protein A2W31_04055 [Planctomycetes bacterium RBG_16_64_10]|nr:MAG: hypothetical protein A2W31_04055 [Planctomycetes bacterium RBG_16_64_10]